MIIDCSVVFPISLILFVIIALISVTREHDRPATGVGSQRLWDNHALIDINRGLFIPLVTSPTA